MDTDKFELLLDMRDANFVDDLTSALGVEKGQSITVIPPQFERTDGRVIKYFPRTVEEYDALKLLPSAALITLGCQLWEKTEDAAHWLYPKEWYSYIPNGMAVVGISGNEYPFVRGESCNDVRFGALAYGFLQPLKEIGNETY